MRRVHYDVAAAATRPCDASLLGSIFRGVHTVTMTSRFYEVAELEFFSHAFERLLDALRDRAVVVAPEVMDLVMEGTDTIGDIIDACARGEHPSFPQRLLERFLEEGAEQSFNQLCRT